MRKENYFLKFWPVYLITSAIFLSLLLSTDKAVTVFSENKSITRENTIVIDAGHGGEDGGAISVSGIPESQINLKIALRLNDLLHLLGYQTVMIRSTDISVYTDGNTLFAKKISDLKQRVYITNKTNGAILLSIHQNTFSDQRYSGAQVFYAPTITSRELAINLQSAFVKTCNPTSNRKAKPADVIYLMQHITCPGILIECGFLSNPTEEANLRTKDYQNRLCCVIAAVLGNYLEEE